MDSILTMIKRASLYGTYVVLLSGTAFSNHRVYYPHLGDVASPTTPTIAFHRGLSAIPRSAFALFAPSYCRGAQLHV